MVAMDWRWSHFLGRDGPLKPKSNLSPLVELIPKFRKPKLKSNPLVISTGSLESDVMERQLVSPRIRGGQGSPTSETRMIYMWTVKSGQEVVKVWAQCCQSCIVVMDDNGILRTNAFHMYPILAMTGAKFPNSLAQWEILHETSTWFRSPCIKSPNFCCNWLWGTP